MTETLASLSLGQQLKNAREAVGLSIDDVAQKTNLKKGHIEALENDIFILPNVPPAFVRGYVRNYVRFLRLPESLISEANYGEVTIPKDVKKAAPIQVSNHKAQTRWVKWLTWLILLAAVGMTLAWWWQEHKKDEQSRETLVSSTETLTSQPTNSAPQAVEIPAQTANVETAPAVAPVTESAPVIATQPEIQPTTTETPVSQPVVVEPAAQPVEPAVQTVEQPVESVNVLQQTAVTETTTATETTAVVGNEELRIEISGGQSWITVRSPKAKRSLAEKLYNDGEVLSFNDNEQYRLTIGAPANVKIYYKGQQVPLKVDGRVARIKLPQ